MSKTAFITGASSGIGAEFARQLAAKKYDLVIHGRRENLLINLADKLRKKYNINVNVVTAELTCSKQIQRLADLIGQIENLEILINNAGFTTREYFYDEPLSSQLGILDVHLRATVVFSHAALKIMIAKNHGSIINVSSVAGFFAAPTSSMYCATKSFLNTFTQSLSLELDNTDIKVQALCPGYTLSDFHTKIGYAKDDKRFKKFMSAEFVVRNSLKDLEHNRVFSIPGVKYKIMVVLSKFLPHVFFNHIAKKRYEKRRKNYTEHL